MAQVRIAASPTLESISLPLDELNVPLDSKSTSALAAPSDLSSLSGVSSPAFSASEISTPTLSRTPSTSPPSSSPSPPSSSADLPSEPTAADTEAPATPARDPHVLPTFSRASSPILYLPPLLSSLPTDFPPEAPGSAAHKPPRPLALTTVTRLPSIDPASLALHRALHHFHPLDASYATTPYPEAFNWEELALPAEAERDWFCVAFRSKRKDGSDSGPLYDADKKAHEEAIQNGGLIMYWYGTPDPETGLNLATCIWQSRAHAAAANSRPHHIRAVRLAAASYERYDLERYRLRKVRGETGVHVLPFDGGEVGW